MIIQSKERIQLLHYSVKVDTALQENKSTQTVFLTAKAATNFDQLYMPCSYTVTKP
uniref:Uncharacterized protein n=1 Tax=Anguilla anguilla TaxID=7936 RepID=A0A0E9R939_ANGAN